VAAFAGAIYRATSTIIVRLKASPAAGESVDVGGHGPRMNCIGKGGAPSVGWSAWVRPKVAEHPP
jgi:hypothetical protein